MNEFKNVENLGGGMYASICSVKIIKSTFRFNMADYGEAMATQVGNIISVYNSSFTNNSAKFNGGAFITYQDRIHLMSSDFVNNSAIYGGSIEVILSSISATDINFVNSISYKYGAI